jgi:lysozyme family protein
MEKWPICDFDQAVEFVLGHEGGYSNDPNDPGGETNFGISKRSYPDVDIKNLTREGAKEIYRRDFWLFDQVENQRLASKIMDAYVNSKHHSIRILQMSLGTIQAGPIVADGNWGSQTEAHVNAADSEKLLKEFKARLCKMHFDDSLLNPKEANDLLGWLRRDVDG